MAIVAIGQILEHLQGHFFDIKVDGAIDHQHLCSAGMRRLDGAIG